MHNKPQKCEILEDRQRTSGHSLQATWDTQHSEFHTYAEVCVCPEESLVTYKCSIRKIFSNSISSTQSNHLWGPCRLYSDKFPAKFSYKIVLNSTSILWWPPEGPGHSSKMGLCHPIHLDRCSLKCRPQGPFQTAGSSRALPANQEQLPTVYLHF